MGTKITVLERHLYRTVVSGDSLWCLMSHCDVWRFAVVPGESLWCLQIRCGV